MEQESTSTVTEDISDGLDQDGDAAMDVGVTVAAAANCPTCSAAAAPATYVYAIGQIEPRFPTLSLEKEYAQRVGGAGTAGKTDRQVLHEVLSHTENRYLTRQMCWVMTVQGVETYLLTPRDPRDFDRLAEAIRPEPSPTDLDVAIGALGPMAPPDLCNGLMVPIVVFDQVYSFDRATLIDAIPRVEEMKKSEFEAAAREVLDRICQVTDNAGATPDHRALNYLALRYPQVYRLAVEQFGAGASLTQIDVRPSHMKGARQVVDVIMSYTNRATDFTEKFFVRVDVTEEFPFLVSKLSPYLDH